ncbi:MAG: 30S ribosomal protein S6 [Candidatus Marinimicrobia bacterium]|nr:30S ribosomal protein S6 [Candidatus Neomarinimicrobiota bacterium]
MRYYETLFIISSDYKHDKISYLVDSVEKQFKKMDANILNTNDWGKRKMAYRINGEKYGNYVLIQAETENGDFVKEIENWMKYTEGILSYLTVRLDEKPVVKENQ